MNKQFFTIISALLLMTGIFSFCMTGCNKESNERITIVNVSPQFIIGGLGPPSPYDYPYIVYFLKLTEERTNEVFTVYKWEINGFEYEEGYEYRLKIRISKIINPSSDGPIEEYLLLEMLSKNKVICDELVVSPEPKSEMIFVEGGTFIMGGTDDEPKSSELPPHQVTLSNFFMGKYPVMQAQWIAIMGSNPSYYRGDHLPVEKVSWNDIVGTSGSFMELNGIRYYENGFIYKLNTTSGKEYRLPTEEEWEYAARGGNKSNGFKYSGSNNEDDVAWYDVGSNSTTMPVGLKQGNELGIYDMSGNIWEWCQDWEYWYSDLSPTNPSGPSDGRCHMVRGGRLSGITKGTRVSARCFSVSDSRYRFLGFRLACSSE